MSRPSRHVAVLDDLKEIVSVRNELTREPCDSPSRRRGQEHSSVLDCSGRVCSPVRQISYTKRQPSYGPPPRLHPMRSSVLDCFDRWGFLAQRPCDTWSMRERRKQIRWLACLGFFVSPCLRDLSKDFPFVCCLYFVSAIICRQSRQHMCEHLRMISPF